MASPAKRQPRRRGARRAARPHPSPAESHLLALARELTAIARAEPPPPDAVAAAVRTLASAWGPGEPLARQVAQAWLRSRGDKTGALALAWAREQVRLALQEVLERSADGGRSIGPISPETRAWLLVAACETLAREPSGAAPDRLRTLLQLSGRDERRA